MNRQRRPDESYTDYKANLKAEELQRRSMEQGTMLHQSTFLTRIMPSGVIRKDRDGVTAKAVRDNVCTNEGCKGRGICKGTFVRYEAF